MIALLFVLLLQAVAAVPPPGSVAEAFRVDSWKQGPREIEKLDLTLPLNCEKQPRYERVIRDSGGREAFKLSVFPAEDCTSEGTSGWVVSLMEAGERDYEFELLKPTVDPGQDYFLAEDFPGYFIMGTEDNRNGDVVPLYTPRIVKVGGFHLGMRCLRAKYSDGGMLASMVIEVAFANDPSPF